MLSHKTEQGEARPSCGAGGLCGGRGRGLGLLEELTVWVLGHPPAPALQTHEPAWRKGLGVWGWLRHVGEPLSPYVAWMGPSIPGTSAGSELSGMGLLSAVPILGGCEDHLPGQDARHLQSTSKKFLGGAVCLPRTRVLVGSSEPRSAFFSRTP